MLTVLDLFSCVGGHALGLHGTGGFRTVAMVESDPFRRRILARHFPDVPLFEDVRTFVGLPGMFDVVVGGPPCQSTSTASAIHGKRSGESLWSEMRRIINESQPAWIIVEQPPGNAAWEAEVKGDVAQLGYHSSRIVLSAESLGAPHLRRRVFLLAHRDLSRLQVAGGTVPSAIAGIKGGTSHRNPWSQTDAGSVRVDDGVPGWLEFLAGEKVNEKMDDSQEDTTRRIARWKVLRAMWQHGELAETSPGLFERTVRDFMPEMPHCGGLATWFQEAKISPKLRGVWESFHSKPFEETQDLQRKLLEYAREDQRSQTLAQRRDRRDRIRAIGDSNPPVMMTVIGQAILRAESQTVS